MNSQQEIPTGRELGDIVNLVAESMFERHFVLHDDFGEAAHRDTANGVQLPLQGDKRYYLRGCWHTSSDPKVRGERALAELGEMLNIVAGQIKSQFMLSWEIGLPQQWAAGEQGAAKELRGLWLQTQEGDGFLWVELTAEDEPSKQGRT